MDISKTASLEPMSVKVRSWPTEISEKLTLYALAEIIHVALLLLRRFYM